MDKLKLKEVDIEEKQFNYNVYFSLFLLSVLVLSIALSYKPNSRLILTTVFILTLVVLVVTGIKTVIIGNEIDKLFEEKREIIINNTD